MLHIEPCAFHRAPKLTTEWGFLHALVTARDPLYLDGFLTSGPWSWTYRGQVGSKTNTYGSWQLIDHLSYSLNSLKGGYIGDYIGEYYRGY